MYELTLRGDAYVLGRGTQDKMRAMRDMLAKFHGRDISDYQIKAA